MSHKQLETLSQECRDAIIETITKTGGHLASNLGVVELTLALHRAFDSPKDRLVWDTSNQCYTHKLVTGRRSQFASIRTPGGLSGFAEPNESAHDTLAAGHAGTGLSYGLGVSMALQGAKDDPYVVVIVGDGALTSGPSYEALEQHRPRQAEAPHRRSQRQRLVDLGERRLDGALAQPLRAASRPTGSSSRRGTSSSSVCPTATRPGSSRGRSRAPSRGSSCRTSSGTSSASTTSVRWTGTTSSSSRRRSRARKDVSADGTPVVIHALTHKGRGYTLAEDNPCKFHQPGTPTGAPDSAPRFTYSQVFARTLIRLMEKDEKIVAISAAMLEGTALIEVKKRFPERVYDVGIAEEHAVIMAAGMAKEGWKPVVAIYSTFLQRSYDQLIHDVCLQNLPVTVCIDRAGLVGDDGKTHQGIFDVAYTRGIPNMTVAAGQRRERAAASALHGDRVRPSVRGPLSARRRARRAARRGARRDPDRQGRDPSGRGQGPLSSSPTARWCRWPSEAAAMLAERGIDCGVANARFAKPLDSELLAARARVGAARS